MKIVKSSGERLAPERILLMSAEGGGKSSFAATIPGAVFFDLESSTDKLNVHERAEVEDEVTGKPRPPRDLAEFKAFLAHYAEPANHPSAIVIDTWDWLVRMIEIYVCRKKDWDVVADGSYKVGAESLMSAVREVIAELDRFQRATGAHLVFLSHATVRMVYPLDGEKFNAYSMRCRDEAALILREWCTLIMYAEIDADNPDLRKVTCAKTKTVPAKNRLCLPTVMPLNSGTWGEIDKIRRMDPMVRAAEVFKGHPKETETLDWLGRQANRRNALAHLMTKLESETK